jgi:TrmH family RNA methyltransferase
LGGNELNTIEITSPTNDRIKALGRLRNRREREARGLFFIEGKREIQHATRAGIKIEELYLNQEVLSVEDVADLPFVTDDFPIYLLSERAFAAVGYREHTEGIIAVARIPVLKKLDEVTFKSKPFILVLEGVEKPGNIGAILRTAEGAGVDALILCDPESDLWNPNTIRASIGTIFTVPIVNTSSENVRAWCQKQSIVTIAASPDGKGSYSDVDLTKPTAIVMGSEDRGLSDNWRSSADALVCIPMAGKHDSLNVSVSTAIMLYEVVRQRGLTA